MTKKFYAIVVFGKPANFFRNTTEKRGQAIEIARKIKGSGTCTNAKVYECANMKLAETADFGRIRRAEYCIYDA